DGPVGSLCNVVVSEETGEITMLVIAPEDGTHPILVPASLLARSAGSALFLSVNRGQFARAAARAARFDRTGFGRTDLKKALRGAAAPSASNLPRVTSASAEALVGRHGGASTATLPTEQTTVDVKASITVMPESVATSTAQRRLMPIGLLRRQSAPLSTEDESAVASTGG
ncbi:MAG: hypothetical protein ACR2J8_14000, partial [Thermomicrobiales bacterium]